MCNFSRHFILEIRPRKSVKLPILEILELITRQNPSQLAS